MGSGGKVIIEVTDRIGETYKIERIYGQQAKVYRKDEFIPGLRPYNLLPIVYYGQKDLQEK